MTKIACKFGGTSLADAAQFRKVADIVRADPARRFVVVSAPGKRHRTDPKVTDILLSAYDLARRGFDATAQLQLAGERFLEIERDLGVDAGIADLVEDLKARVTAGTASKGWIISRGEAWSSRLMATFLGASRIEAEGSVFLTSKRLVDPKTYDLVAAQIRDGINVMPGFYGTGPDGEVHTFSRGGSDISGAILARAAGCDLYENWTDVSGLLMADPRVVPDARPMKQLTYRELRELAYAGANVFHEEAILPCRAAGIPIRIANTNRPEDRGTLIVPEAKETNHIIAGVAGRRGFSILQIEKALMNKEKGFGRRVLGVLESKGVSYELSPSGIDSMCVVIEREQFQPLAEEILSEIRSACDPDAIEVEDSIALIATVGHGMGHRPGVAATLFSALAEAHVNVRLIDQGASELSIIVGVDEADCNNALSAIYHAFVAGK